MNKLNSFVVISVADNIIKMNDTELNMLAEILAGSVGERLCNFLSFAIQDTDLMRKEIDGRTLNPKIKLSREERRRLKYLLRLSPKC